MIHSFSCKNFYSFKEGCNTSFVVNNKAPKTDAYITLGSGVCVSKILTVIGPNASGKTNLLKVLPFLSWFIRSSFTADPNDEILIKPFAFSNYSKQPIFLEVNFEIDKKIYNYTIELTQQQVLHEQLKVGGNTKSITLFERRWDTKTNSYSFSGKDFPKGFEKTLRKNASIISTALRLNHKLSLDIGKYWEKIITNVAEFGKIEKGIENDVASAVKFFYENKDFKKTADDLIAQFDLGLSGIDIIKPENREYYKVSGNHIIDGKKESLSFQYESVGTKRLLILLPPLLRVLNDGGTVILDEFDTDLHPSMIAPLLDLFTSKDTNLNNAQIIFSAHSPQVLNSVDKYQVILVEKDERCSSDAWRLDKMDGVRPDDNYYKKYITGAYGAVPNI